MAGKPMTWQAFLVLTALADGPMHGYGIVREVADLSQGQVRLKIGSLYGLLDRLSSEKLIEPDRDEPHDGRLRRYYRLTRDGRGTLAEEVDLRTATARVARAKLGAPRPEPSRPEPPRPEPPCPEPPRPEPPRPGPGLGFPRPEPAG